MKQLITFIFILGVFSSLFSQQNPYSKLVYPGENGKLVYKPYNEKGDIIPDFSYCGYMSGGIDIPKVPVVATIMTKESQQDDTPIIQAVIDSVSKLKPDEKGFRGTILLKKGTYKIASPLRINASGIVLRGEGNNKENGTILLATSPKKYNVIELGIDTNLTPIKDSERNITDIYVPSGSSKIHVENAASIYKVGDKIIVQRPSTFEWVHTISMDSIPPRPLKGESTYDSFNRLRQTKGNTDMNGTVQWKPGSKDLYFERIITSVNGNEIILDIPLTNALQKEFGGALVYKYEFPERISQCGIENLYGMSVYDENIKQDNEFIGMYCCDENHANNFVFCNAVENAWIKDVNVEHFDCCVWISRSAKFITGQDLSAINPISIITGGRRYAYSVWGQMSLFQRCYSSHHRHEFVLGPTVAGPNAFVNGKGDMTFASSEPHQRWAAGCLYDNITIKGPSGSLLAVNRGWYGSGHGWSGAQIIFWNCSAPVIMVMRPPTAQNFAIGSGGIINDRWSENSCKSTISAINGVSRSNFMHDGVPSVGDGWIEFPDTEVKPQSLYYAQLKDRLANKTEFVSISQSNLSETDQDKKMKWWREARFGMFIHWGPYAILGGVYNDHQQRKGGAEWIMNRCKIPVAEYQSYASQFNPVKYDPDSWVRLAKDAGMKYIIITSKHHDGFAMFKSQASKFNIVDFTPYKKDILEALANACRKHGMKLGFYYSQAQDWNNPGGSVARKIMSEGWLNPDSAKIDAYTETHNGSWDPIQETRTMEQYIDDVAVPQIKELLTNYGDVAVIWWDTPVKMTDEFAEKLQNEFKKYPQIITNDRLKRPNFPGDYRTPEQKIPDPSELDGKDWETCMTMNSSWGFKSYDQNWKSTETLIRNLINIASKGGNYLLNVGPTAKGEIPEESIKRLKEVGKWMKINGESIYGTTKSPIKKPDWGCCTMKNNNDNTILYLSVFDWPENGELHIPDLKASIISAKLLTNNTALKTGATDDGIIVYLPHKAPDKIASVIKLELNQRLSLKENNKKNGNQFKILDE